MSRFIPIIVMAVVLVGCGPPLVWDRPQTSDATIHADLQDCRRMARQQAFHETWPSFGYPGFYRRGHYDRRSGLFYRDPFGDPFFEREHREASLGDFCMRARGYRLTPLQTEGG